MCIWSISVWTRDRVRRKTMKQVPESKPESTAATGFFDPAGFHFVRHLERSAPAIRVELDRLLTEDRLTPWPETQLYNRGWDVFGFLWFGKRLEENCALCPRTATAVARVPNVTSAGFSRLVPGALIRPHKGITEKVLRCHLGLIVPPNCGIRVGGETRTWRENSCLIFDDTLEHEAWNRSGEDRVVLLIDFLKEPAARARSEG